MTDIKITELTKCGKGLGLGKDAEGEFECEVPFTLPGDYIRAQVLLRQANRSRGELTSILVPSPLRVTPRCSEFGSCNGCQLQHIPYKGQLLHKEKIIRDHFASIMNQHTIQHSIIASKTFWNYRSEMSFSFGKDRSGKLQLGLPEALNPNSTVNVKECFLSPQWFIDALICVKQWWGASKISAYDPVVKKGVLRYLTLKEGRRSGDRMVILDVIMRAGEELGLRHLEKFVLQIKEYVEPHQTGNQLSVFLRVCRPDETGGAGEYDMLLHGPGFIRESCKIHFAGGNEPFDVLSQVESSSFLQPNPHQTDLFYSRALELCDLQRDDVIYDLYCDNGVLGLCASKWAEFVIGIDPSIESISRAIKNAQLNECQNISFQSGPVGNTIRKLQEEGGRMPRIAALNGHCAEKDAEAVHHLIKLNAPVLLYTSFSAEAQAKNAAVLVQNGYQLTDIQPIDLFPQTNKVGNIIVFKIGSHK